MNFRDCVLCNMSFFLKKKEKWFFLVHKRINFMRGENSEKAGAEIYPLIQMKKINEKNT